MGWDTERKNVAAFCFGIDWVMAFHFKSIKLLFLPIKKSNGSFLDRYPSGDMLVAISKSLKARERALLLCKGYWLILERCNLPAKRRFQEGYLVYILYICGSLFWLLEWSLNPVTGLVRGVENVLFGGEKIGGEGWLEFPGGLLVSQDLSSGLNRRPFLLLEPSCTCSPPQGVWKGFLLLSRDNIR